MTSTKNETAMSEMPQHVAAPELASTEMPRTKFRALLIIASLLTLGLTNTQLAYAAPPSDPCSLLSHDRVAAALGVDVGAGKQAGKADCEWSQSGGGILGKSVLLEILGPMGSSTPVERFETVKTPLPVKGVRKEPASGIGDEAIYVVTGSSRVALYVKKGNFVFRVQITGLKTDEARAKEKTLALDAVSKL